MSEVIDMLELKIPAADIHARAGADRTQYDGGHQSDMIAEPPAEPASEESCRCGYEFPHIINFGLCEREL